MRPAPVDHSLWLAVGHAAQLSSSIFMGSCESDAIVSVNTLILRALEQGANPDSEFTLPGKREGHMTLTCMERAFGQLHGDLLVPLLSGAVAAGWSANSLPNGLWAAGQRAPESSRSPVDPSPWRLPASHLEQEPGWLQLVAQGNPWGAAEVSGEICRLLIRAGAPLVRPAQARLDGSEAEGYLAYKELPEALRLSVSRRGNLNVAAALIEAGALEHWSSPDSVKHLEREVEFSWSSPPDRANTLISMIKAHREAMVLRGSTDSIVKPPSSNARRAL